MGILSSLANIVVSMNNPYWNKLPTQDFGNSQKETFSGIPSVQREWIVLLTRADTKRPPDMWDLRR